MGEAPSLLPPLPPSFWISIKCCCFVNAALWLALLLQATWTGREGGGHLELEQGGRGLKQW